MGKKESGTEENKEPWFSDLGQDSAINKDTNIGGGVCLGTAIMNSIFSIMGDACNISIQKGYSKGN